MVKYTSERGRNGKPRESLPRTPQPSAANAQDGMENAREKARRYLPDWVDTCAAIALSPDSDCGLHTRYLCGHELSSIAGAIPQPLPSLPLHSSANGGHELG
jgi:hypothetical protein